MKSFKDVCNYLIFASLDNKIDIDTSKLSKLVYLCNLLAMAVSGQRLTVERIVCLKTCPGVKEVFEYYLVTETLTHNPYFRTMEAFSKVFSSSQMEMMNEIVMMHRNFTSFGMTEMIMDSLEYTPYYTSEINSLIDDKYLEKASKRLFPGHWKNKKPDTVLASYQEKGISITCTYVKFSEEYKLEYWKNTKLTEIRSFAKEETAVQAFRDIVCKLTAELSVNSTLDKMDAEIKANRRPLNFISLR
jgi:uncharacterized phage-associated protein